MPQPKRIEVKIISRIPTHPGYIPGTIVAMEAALAHTLIKQFKVKPTKPIKDFKV